jgi:hypothetical protein
VQSGPRPRGSGRSVPQEAISSNRRNGLTHVVIIELRSEVWRLSKTSAGCRPRLEGAFEPRPRENHASFNSDP